MEEISYTLIYRKRFYILTVVFFHLVTFPRVSCPPLSFTCLEFSLAVIYFCICGALKYTAFLHSLPFFLFYHFFPAWVSKEGYENASKSEMGFDFFCFHFSTGTAADSFFICIFLVRLFSIFSLLPFL